MRDYQSYNRLLGDYALPNRFVAVPLSEFNNDDIHDDVSYDGCPYIGTVSHDRMNDDAVFENYMWMKTGTREPIKAMYDLTDDYIDGLNYHHYWRLTDC